VEVRKEAVGEPQLVYLGYESYLATYEVAGQSVAVDMRTVRAARTSDLKAHLAAPEQREAEKGHDAIVQSTPTSFELPMTIRRQDDICISADQRNNNCAPTSGAMIVEYYKQSRGYSAFHDWCQNHSRLYHTMQTNTYGLPGTMPWNIGPGWTLYAHERGYRFGTTYYGPSDSDYDLVRAYINARQPIIVLFWGGSPYTNWHACAIRGHGISASGRRQFVINDPHGFKATLDWAYHRSYTTIHWLWPQ
jgi:hypothetical protein